MAFLTDPEQVYRTMRLNNCPYYKVTALDKALEVYDTNIYNDTLPDIETAIENLKFTLGNLSGAVSISVMPKGGKAEGEGRGGDVKTKYFKWNYKLGKDEAPINGNHTPQKGYGMIGNSNLELIMALMEKNHSKDLELQKLQNDIDRKFKEYEDRINGTQENAVNPAITQALGILEKMLNAPATPAKAVNIAGIPEQPKTKIEKIEMTPEQKQKLNACIHVLLTNDPEFLNNLEKLAKLSSEKPLIYSAAVNQLNSL